MPVFLLRSFFRKLSAKCRAGNHAGIYYWKTSLLITGFESDYLDALPARKLYLRFFDIDWEAASGQPRPVAVVEKAATLPESIELIPVVFITNRTFLNLPDEDIPSLAENVLKKIFLIALDFPEHEVKELQFDCDWSPKTRQKYFEFLRQVRLKLVEKPILLSSTIRLHQVRYFEKTGVPPADRGVLMFYNMGDLEDIQAENTILDLNIAKQYLDNFGEYPLPLDIALPLFSWGVLIREGKMISLINNLSVDDLEEEDRFSKISESRFEVAKSTYLQGYYLYKGDVLRIESAPAETLLESAELLSNVLKTKDLSLIFYHLDSVSLNKYPHETLEKICDIFR